MRRTTKPAPARRQGLQTLRDAWQRLSMVLLLMMLTTMTAWAQGVDYIDANGVEKNIATDDIVDNDNPTVLMGGGETTLSEGWYVVNRDITYTGTVTITGDVTIILGNGHKMNIGTSEKAMTGSGIYGSGHNLTIYGQTLDESTAGQLRIYISSYYSNDAGILIFPGTGTYTQHSGNVTINSYGNAISVSGNISINGGKLDATASTPYLSSKDVFALAGSNITMTGGILNATGIASQNPNSAYGIACQKTFTLGWRNASDRFTASSFAFGTVTIADGQAFTINGTDIYSGTLDDKTSIAGKTLQPAVPYLDASGNTTCCTDFTVLTGSETYTEINNPGWYVVTNSNTDANVNGGVDVSYPQGLTISGGEGDVNLILCDGAEMSVEVNDNSVFAMQVSGNSFNIYGQSNGTGKLTASTYNDYGIYAVSCDMTINGGTIEASGGTYGIFSSKGNIKYNGGIVEANGIEALDGYIVLNWTNASDRITASSFTTTVSGGTSITSGKAFTDGAGGIYTGVLSDDDKDAVRNVTLIGVDVLEDAAANDVATLATSLDGKQTNVALNGRTLKAGKWNTLCLPFPMSAEQIAANDSPLKGATIRTLKNCTIEESTLTIAFANVDAIVAGTPYIVMLDGNVDISNPVFRDVTVSNVDPATKTVSQGVATFVGTYAPVTLAGDNNPDRRSLFLQDNMLYYPENTATINAFRGYFTLSVDAPDPSSLGRAIIDFGDGNSTAIDLIRRDAPVVDNASFFDLQGRRVEKPMKGIYIQHGKKIVIK